MALDTLSKVLTAAVPGEDLYKASATAEGAGTWHSLWTLAGRPAAGANPPAYTAGAGYVPTSATTGALRLVDPVGGISKVSLLSATSSANGTLIIYDRLWACSGLTTAAATTLNITTPGSITRNYTSYVGTELWGEVYSSPGATTATWTVSYTNQAGTTGRTATYTHPANAESAGQMFPFLLAAGDTGVQAVASFTTSVSSGTAGSIGLTILRRIAEIPLVVGTKGILDGFGLGLPSVNNGACLAMMVQCSGTASGILTGRIVLSQE